MPSVPFLYLTCSNFLWLDGNILLFFWTVCYIALYSIIDNPSHGLEWGRGRKNFQNLKSPPLFFSSLCQTSVYVIIFLLMQGTIWLIFSLVQVRGEKGENSYQGAWHERNFFYLFYIFLPFWPQKLLSQMKNFSRTSQRTRGSGQAEIVLKLSVFVYEAHIFVKIISTRWVYVICNCHCGIGNWRWWKWLLGKLSISLRYDSHSSN